MATLRFALPSLRPALPVALVACAWSPLLSGQGALDEAMTASVVTLRPKVEWQRSGTRAWPAATEGSVLMRGDRLRTGPQAFAELRYGDGSIARVGALSTFTLSGEGRRELRLEGGRVWLQIRKGGAGMRVITPGAVAAVTGTELMVGYDPAKRSTEVTVFEGAVQVSGDLGNLVRLQAGTFTRVVPTMPAPPPLPLTTTQVEQRTAIFRALSLPGAMPTAAPTVAPTAPPSPVAPTPTAAPSAVPTAVPTLQPTPEPEPPAAAPSPAVRPDLRRQTDQLMDPRVLNGSPTTGGVRVIIE